MRMVWIEGEAAEVATVLEVMADGWPLTAGDAVARLEREPAAAAAALTAPSAAHATSSPRSPAPPKKPGGRVKLADLPTDKHAVVMQASEEGWPPGQLGDKIGVHRMTARQLLLDAARELNDRDED